MDARGLVAVIITVHETALALGALTFVFLALIGALALRTLSGGKRAAITLVFAVGGALLIYGVTARHAGVQPVDVELVHAGE